MREANWNLFSRETRLCYVRIKEALEMYGWNPKGEVIELAQVMVKCALEQEIPIDEFKEIVQTMLNLYAQVVTHPPSGIKSFEGTKFSSGEEESCQKNCASLDKKGFEPDEKMPVLSYKIPDRPND